MRKYTECCSLQTSTSNPYSGGYSLQTVPCSSTKGTRPVWPNFPINNRVTPFLTHSQEAFLTHTTHTIIHARACARKFIKTHTPRDLHVSSKRVARSHFKSECTKESLTTTPKTIYYQHHHHSRGCDSKKGAVIDRPRRGNNRRAEERQICMY